jgi:hypothetical protein
MRQRVGSGAAHLEEVGVQVLAPEALQLALLFGHLRHRAMELLLGPSLHACAA